MESVMDGTIEKLAQVEVEEVYNEDHSDYRCKEPLDCLGCGLCSVSKKDNNG
jgi:hypothetical protein